MTQKLLHVMAPDDQLRDLQRQLEAAGFRVGPSGRNVGGLHVRIREEGGDEDEVRRIAAEVAPDVHWGPPGAPTTTLQGYREDR